MKPMQPGGRYLVGDEYFNADGVPLGEKAPPRRSARGGQSDNPPAFDVETATKADLIAEVDRRNAAGAAITVVRTDGKDGDLRAEDYRAALKS